MSSKHTPEDVDEVARVVANARLIAAAPVMLAALKRALTLDAVSPDCEEIYNDIRAAIRAAEGGEW